MRMLLIARQPALYPERCQHRIRVEEILARADEVIEQASACRLLAHRDILRMQGAPTSGHTEGGMHDDSNPT